MTAEVRGKKPCLGDKYAINFLMDQNEYFC